ncbi:MAG: ATP-dependent protease ATPase subunit HslU [Candidatus Marinimicrobia bacterium]|nr:ATP-dependent protease ATPase subunit HslU [Candidatus Neomarinimicrobiota bacterium]
MSKFSLTPKQIVHELDKYIIGQDSAKKSVAIALRNRWRRQQVTSEIRDEILPNNIIMIGSTGVGKTEIARRLSNLVQAPFVKVEASKFTEVGYVGRDVDSMIRDLVDNSYVIVKSEHEITVREMALEMTNERIMDLLLPPLNNPDKESAEYQRYQTTRGKMYTKLMAGDFEDRQVEFNVQEDSSSAMMQIFSPMGMDDLGMNIQDMLGNAMPKKKKMRRLSVTEARVLITAEESDKLIDEEKVQHEAIRRAEQDGIVFVDEIDKIAVERGGSGPDVSREGVQRDILPIIEGSTVKTKYGTLTTDHILFIAAGAFHMSKPSDLIPELQGRFPIRVELENLTEDDFIQILTQPKSALLKQYTALVGAEDVKITFNKDAIAEIARVAFEVNESMENIGARRLHTIMSKLLEETLFDLPDDKTKSIKVTKSMVIKTFKDTMADQDLSKYIL